MLKLCNAVAQLAIASLLIALAGPGAAQQTYPNKPIRIVVPYPPGGSTDILARLVAQQLTDAWGQQVLVDNRGGGNTLIGTEHVVKAAPDGYTLLLTTNAHVVVPQLTTAPFDPIKDFAPIATLSSTEYFLVVHPGVPVNTLQEFIALAKAKSGQINYASAGGGSANHLAGELFVSMAGVKIQHIPYKGSGPAIADLMGGQVQASFQTPIVSIPFIKSGKMKALAVSGDNRLSAVPQVSTFAEAGLPGFNPSTWYGIIAPANTPKPIIDKLENELKRIVATPEFREKLATLGLDPLFKTSAQFAELMKSDMAKFAKVIKASNIKLD